MVSRWGMTYSNSLDFLYTRFTLRPHSPPPPFRGYLLWLCFLPAYRPLNARFLVPLPYKSYE